MVKPENQNSLSKVNTKKNQTNCGIFLSAECPYCLTGCCTHFSAILNYISGPVHQKHVAVNCPLSSTMFAKPECLALLS